jgi:alpha-D-ribose 1-methylphosphonate 5-triphosphate diphosphatase
LLLLHQGTVVQSDKCLTEHSVLIRDGKIERVVCSNDVDTSAHITIDCSGLFIMPGFIDIHSDVLETMIVPRKGIIMDVEIALFEIDKQLISQGITTTYHSISIANSTVCDEKRTLSIEQMLEIGRHIAHLNNGLLIDHKYHARLEVNTIEVYEEIADMIRDGAIDELSLMDHTPGQG